MRDDTPTVTELDADLTASQRRGCNMLLSIFLLPVIAAVRGCAIMLVWEWFVTPATGWAPVGYWVAVGLGFVPQVFRAVDTDDADAAGIGPYRTLTATIIGIAGYLITTGLAWVVHGIAT